MPPEEICYSGAVYRKVPSDYVPPEIIDPRNLPIKSEAESGWYGIFGTFEFKTIAGRQMQEFIINPPFRSLQIIVDAPCTVHVNNKVGKGFIFDGERQSIQISDLPASIAVNKIFVSSEYATNVTIIGIG